MVVVAPGPELTGAQAGHLPEAENLGPHRASDHRVHPWSVTRAVRRARKAVGRQPPRCHDRDMSRFASYDGTEIEFRTLGHGRPLVCLPGGPGRASEYLGDLGGLDSSRQLILPDTRGTGASADAADPGTYRCARLVQDVEALRVHLGLASMDLLGHSAAGNLALQYAAAYPERLDHLVLVPP